MLHLSSLKYLIVSDTMVWCHALEINVFNFKQCSKIVSCLYMYTSLKGVSLQKGAPLIIPGSVLQGFAELDKLLRICKYAHNVAENDVFSL